MAGGAREETAVNALRRTIEKTIENLDDLAHLWTREQVDSEADRCMLKIWETEWRITHEL